MPRRAVSRWQPRARERHVRVTRVVRGRLPPRYGARQAARVSMAARGLRASLRDAAAERGTLIASAGTHPFSRYEHQDVTDAPRYVGLIEKMQWVAERELIFGLHVRVGMGSGDETIWVANARRTRLPELLALSSNSPFWP